MLEVSTYLAPSKIQGIGLFASNKICNGDVVWRYDQMTTIAWTEQEWENMRSSLSKIAFENIERFAYFNRGKWLLNLDDGRFMNHSNNPNLGYDREKDMCFALRDISDGEELTVLYSEFCDKSDDNTCKTCRLCSG